MSLSYDIRKIQQSTSTKKIKEVQETFREVILDCASLKETAILRTICKIIQNNINGCLSVDDFSMPEGISFEEARFIAGKYGLRVTQGGSGAIYLSWSPSLDDLDAQSMCNRLHEAGRQGIIYEEFDRLNRYFPEKKLELLFKSRRDSEHIAIVQGKYAYPVFEDAVYLLSR